MKSDKKIPILKGLPTKSSDVDVQDWIDDISTHIKGKPVDDQLKFIFDHIAGNVKHELTFRGDDVRNNPTKILEVIAQVFSEDKCKSEVRVKQEFYQCMQTEKQSLRLCYAIN